MAATKEERARENYEAYTYARDNGHIDFILKARKCENFFCGLQWEESIRRKLERQGKPVLTINKTLATMATVMGEQLKNRADITFTPGKDGIEQTATMLAKIWVHVSGQNRLDWTESEVAADGFITSRGFFDVRMNFDDDIMGDIEISQWNPRNVVIDCDAEEYDPDKWKRVFLTKWLSLNDIEMLYGVDARKELEFRDSSNFMMGYDSIDYDRQTFGGGRNDRLDTGFRVDDPLRRKIRVIEQQYHEISRREHFVDRVTGDTRLIPVNMERERIQLIIKEFNLGVIKKKVEIIKWLVSADQTTLHDEISPYNHFTVVPYFPFFRYGQTIGFVENIISPQEQLNKTVSQELHIINSTANSGYILKQGALKNMDVEELEARGAETGIVIELDDVNNLEKIQPNVVPTGLDRVSERADNFIKELMGVSDSMRGFDREDVAAKAIQYKQVAGSVNLAKPFDNLSHSRYLLATRVLDLIQTFYTEPRVIQITGRDLRAITETVQLNQLSPEGELLNDLTLGEYNVIVTTVPSRETYDQGQFNEIMQLKQLGLAIPDDLLVEYSHVARKSELVARMKELTGGGSAEAQQAAQQQAAELAQLEQESQKAQTLKTIADARLSEARAAKEQSELQNGGDGTMYDPKVLIERERVAHELAIKAKQIADELALKREQFDHQKEMDDKNYNLDVAKAEDESKRADELHATQIANEKEMHDTKVETLKTKTKVDSEVKRKKAAAKPKKAASG